MRVVEVKALEPKAEVYELTGEGRYIVAVPAAIDPQSVAALRAALVERGVPNVIVIGGADVHIYEFGGGGE